MSASPITVSGNVYGAVALDLEPGSCSDLGGLAARLEWDCTWIEAFIRRHWAPPGDRLVTVIETVATSVHHRHGQSVASVSEVAEKSTVEVRRR